jgi:hypothetical protein
MVRRKLNKNTPKKKTKTDTVANACKTIIISKKIPKKKIKNMGGEVREM